MARAHCKSWIDSCSILRRAGPVSARLQRISQSHVRITRTGPDTFTITHPFGTNPAVKGSWKETTYVQEFPFDDVEQRQQVKIHGGSPGWDQGRVATPILAREPSSIQYVVRCRPTGDC